MKKCLRKTVYILGLVTALVLSACALGDIVETDLSTETAKETMRESLETSEDILLEETEDYFSQGHPTVVAEDDWNKDGMGDQLRVYFQKTKDREYTLGLQLDVSDRETYELRTPWIVSYEEYLTGDFDGDKELEFVFIFDLHAQGAKGGFGLIWVDYEGSQWLEITPHEPFLFTGFSYEVVSDQGGWYHVIGQDVDQEFIIQGEEIPETDGGMVSPFWMWEKIEGGERDALKIWQYAAGGHKINYIGDVVNVLGIKDGKLEIMDEYMTTDYMDVEFR